MATTILKEGEANKKLNGLAILSEGERKTDEKLRENGTAILKKPKEAGTTAVYDIKSPFCEDNARDYLDKLADIQRHLFTGFSIDETIQFTIQDMESEDTIEQKVKDGITTEKDKALNELALKRENFTHLMIVSYLGYLKSHYNDKVNELYAKLGEAQKVSSSADAKAIFKLASALNNYLTHHLATPQPEKAKDVSSTVDRLKKTIPESPDPEPKPVVDELPHYNEDVIPEQLIDAMEVTYKLAFKAIKAYNPQIAEDVFQAKANEISDMFARYFSANADARKNYETALRQERISELLAKVESNLHDSASKVPVYFGILMKRCRLA